jgi:hypothetical protein
MKTSIIFLLILNFSCHSKNIDIDFENAKIKVEVSVSNEIQYAKNRFSGIKHNSILYISEESLKDYLDNTINQIFNNLTINSNEEIKYTHTLRVYESKNVVVANKSGNYGTIRGLGLYKNFKDICAYHVLDFEFTDLKTNKQTKFTSSHPLISIKSRDIKDFKCTFHKLAEKQKLKWKKTINKYNKEELEFIHKSIKKNLLPNIIRTMYNNGIFKTLEQSNRMLVEITKDEYVNIGKENDSNFIIDGDEIKNEDLKNKLLPIIKDTGKDKILFGYNSKLKFTIADLNKLFKPILKESKIEMFVVNKKGKLIQLY